MDRRECYVCGRPVDGTGCCARCGKYPGFCVCSPTPALLRRRRENPKFSRRYLR